ncbi:HAMP domain-containing histidine kinase [Corynebacterium sp. ES2794-CONJ1]|uniref:sensor histidine kinase n=1 Tax=unclassified Corynebacterium TaxID=2624378 RepID=UPI00216817B5|nr:MULTISPECIES: HAMP domain-containing sensor histidine kinase [unclassified Corynebacterium]MCS4490287.1 HAMP domain-containing histidine kinase [Corynebacterium sp. ES2775-CONJ]MCS4491902.1 HAMP domain-containing histidine kinase [Corynebacterium sp. ES2715-CONJ3]MCS4532007.1 HAMP domain-containing histidine kinase [Corynebacterium sp. ES2730-CONJ]MCU9519408.1 HAMP domain-containing histidine kinase [Corynebacterium sp. ES2794-CONJ1]
MHDAVMEKSSRTSRITRAARDPRVGIPLRFILVFVTIFMTGFGLLASGIAIQRSMEAEALTRVDNELSQGLETWAQRDALYNHPQRNLFSLPSDYFVARYYRDGTLAFVSQQADEIPDTRDIRFDGVPRTVRSWNREDKGEWRVIATQRADFIVIVAKEISSDKEFLSRLAAGQISIGFIVLAMVGIFAHVIIQRTLQPLRLVEDTAKAITTGDLDRRAPVLPENTEVGALSRSINVMMEQLQTLIVELKAKEVQMRRFVGDASHELRTPLTSVRGYAELYRSGATQDACMVLDKIEEESSRMSLLVEDLLSLTRAEEKHFEEQPVDLLEIALSVLDSLRGAYPQRDIKVENSAQTLPVVLGDKARLRRVIMNLMVNALKHAGDEATVRVVIGENESAFFIDVADDGVGIEKEDADHIFERFYRADTSRTRSTGGSGLGLAIVKSIVEAHKGAVSVKTAPGEGTIFRVILPRYHPFKEV